MTANFTNAFKPALNKLGFARLEFTGHELKEGVTAKTDKEGEIVERPWSLLSINFDVRGMARGTSQKMSVTCGFTYDAGNTLGITLAALGFEAPKVDVVLDEEGFEVEACEEDEEGFAVADDIDLGIEEFLDSIKGKVFLAKVFKASEGKQKGYWQIDVATLKTYQ